MTIVVAILCTDGVVVAADSMVTVNVEGLDARHHKSEKVAVLNGPQLFAGAGDLGLSRRFQFMADGAYDSIDATPHPIDYPLKLSRMVLEQFQSTGIKNTDAIELNTVLAYIHGNEPYCCIFDGIQPRLLDKNYFYESLGSEKLSANSVLRFLVSVFSPNGPPNVSDGLFLATWTIQHVTNTNPDCINARPDCPAGPIHVRTLKYDFQGTHQDTLVAQELTTINKDMATCKTRVRNTIRSLRDWYNIATADLLPPKP